MTAPNSHRITISPSGRTFSASSTETLLEAALSSGIALPYGCSSGSCGECLAKLLHGEVKKIRFSDFAIPEKLKLTNHTLTCCVSPNSDVVLETQEAIDLSDIPQQQLLASVCRTEHISDTTLITLKFRRGKVFRFFSGQSVCIETRDYRRDFVPVASCPCNGDTLELHLPIDDELTLSLLKQPGRQRITVQGPGGDFVWQDDGNKPALLVASGVGFAPIKGLVEHLINIEHTAPIHIFRINAPSQPMYLANLCRSWDDAFDNIHFFKTKNILSTVEAIAATVKSIEQNNSAAVYVSGPSCFVNQWNTLFNVTNFEQITEVKTMVIDE